MTVRHILALATLAFGSLPSATAQTLHAASNGPFAGVAQAVSVDSATYSGLTPLNKNKLLQIREGFTGAVPVETTPYPHLPDFKMTAMFGTTLAGNLDVNAMSLGWDLVHGDIDGIASIPANTWQALTFSVDRNSIADGVISSEHQREDGAAADVFSYSLPGSVIPSNVVDVVQRALNSDEASLWNDTQQIKGNIDALDTFLPLFEQSDVIFGLLPLFEGIYFSLSKATIDDANINIPITWWFDGSNNLTTPSSASVLILPWSATGGWGEPRVKWSYSYLGLNVTDDLTALAYDKSRQHILFSTNRSDLDQILFANVQGPTTTKKPYKTGPGAKVSGRLKLRNVDRVDAICSVDPTSPLPGVNRLNMSHIIGQPMEPWLNPELNATAFRSFVGSSGEEFLKSHLTGWFPNGHGAGCSAGTYLVVPNAPPILLGAHGYTAGDIVEYEVAIPANTSLSGVDLDLNWAVLEHARLLMGNSNNVRFRL